MPTRVQDLVGGLDQGTTGTRFAIFDRGGRLVASDYRPNRQIHPQPGWVEHDPLEIWADAQAVMRGALAKAGVAAGRLAAIGIANQTETLVVWDPASGQPLGNAVVWQDTRARELCDELARTGLAETVAERTGLSLSSYYTAPKLAWLLRHVPGLRERAESGAAVAGTIDAWLTWNLTGGARAAGGAAGANRAAGTNRAAGAGAGRHVTDYSNASRTMLLDLERLRWDGELAAAFGIPQAMLPEVRPSIDPLGGARTAADVLGEPVPLLASLGDQQAALVGQACFDRWETKLTIGTGTFALANLGETAVRSSHGLVTSVGYGRDPGRCTYVLEGSIAYSGGVIQWLRDGLGIVASETEAEALASDVPDSGGVTLVPAFSGLYAPHWDMTARGLIGGLTGHSDRRHIVRAAYEAICFQAREVLSAMELDMGRRLQEVRVDGGASRSDFLMQLLADTLSRPVLRPAVTEATALGAASLAGLAAGLWSGTDELRSLWRLDRRFDPAEDPARADERAGIWSRAVERSRGW